MIYISKYFVFICVCLYKCFYHFLYGYALLYVLIDVNTYIIYICIVARFSVDNSKQNLIQFETLFTKLPNLAV